jgi:hypothetical protein
MYVFDCICGEKVTTATKQGTCPNCGRPFDLRWAEVTQQPTAPALPVRVQAAKSGA